MYVHLGDIIVASHPEEQHDAHLHTLFHRFSEYGVTINASKCALRKSSVAFSGHIVSSSGIASLPDRVTARRNYRESHAYRQLPEFVGLVKLHRRFISNCAEMIAPLTNLLRFYMRCPKNGRKHISSESSLTKSTKYSLLFVYSREYLLLWSSDRRLESQVHKS